MRGISFLFRRHHVPGHLAKTIKRGAARPVVPASLSPPSVPCTNVPFYNSVSPCYSLLFFISTATHPPSLSFSLSPSFSFLSLPLYPSRLDPLHRRYLFTRPSCPVISLGSRKVQSANSKIFEACTPLRLLLAGSCWAEFVVNLKSRSRSLVLASNFSPLPYSPFFAFPPLLSNSSSLFMCHLHPPLSLSFYLSRFLPFAVIHKKRYHGCNKVERRRICVCALTTPEASGLRI